MESRSAPTTLPKSLHRTVYSTADADYFIEYIQQNVVNSDQHILVSFAIIF